MKPTIGPALTLIVVLWPWLALAQTTTNLPVVLVEPGSMAADGTTGLLRMPSADVVPAGYLSVAIVNDNADWNPGDVDLNQFAVAGAYGLPDGLELFARFNAISRVDTDQPVAPGLSTPESGVLPAVPGFFTGVGDVRFGLKWQTRRRRTRLAVIGGGVLPAPDASVGGDHVQLLAGGVVTRTVSWSEVSVGGGGTFPTRAGRNRELKLSGGVEIRRDLRIRPQVEMDLIRVSGTDQDFPIRADLLVGAALALTHDIGIRPALAANLRFAPGERYPLARNGIGYQLMVYWHPGRVCSD